MARIIIVDDNEQVATVFQEILEIAGYEVERVTNVPEMLVKQISLPADLIVLDLVLGDNNSSGIVGALALRGVGYKGKVVAVTGGLDQTSQMLKDSAGIDGFLLKPVYGSELTAEVNRQLGDSL